MPWLRCDEYLVRLTRRHSAFRLPLSMRHYEKFFDACAVWGDVGAERVCALSQKGAPCVYDLATGDVLYRLEDNALTTLHSSALSPLADVGALMRISKYA